MNRPETVREALKHDPRAAISSDYLAKLEYGDRSLATASMDVREALRLALDVPRAAWESATGLATPAPSALSDLGKSASDTVVSVDTIAIPVYGTVTAGSPADFASEANVTGHETIARADHRNGNTLAVYASGHSMSPTIQDGDLVLADRSLTDLVQGKIYVILVQGEGPCLKRARQVGADWWLTSDNPDYNPFQASEATVLGRVYMSQRKARHD